MVEENKIVKFFKELIPYVVILLIVIGLKKYVVTPVKVNGNSMYPSLDDGDIMILDIISYKLKGLKRFDIVVVDQGKELIIKRVIGLPGEKLEYRNGVLYIDDKKVNDPFIHNQELTENMKLTIPENEYFVLGDNRHNSLDSRTFGTFNKKQILGKTDFTVYPFNKFGIVKKVE